MATAKVRYADLWEDLEPLLALAEEVRRLRPEAPDAAWKRRTRGWLLGWMCTFRRALLRTEPDTDDAGPAHLQTGTSI